MTCPDRGRRGRRQDPFGRDEVEGAELVVLAPASPVRIASSPLAHRVRRDLRAHLISRLERHPSQGRFDDRDVLGHVHRNTRPALDQGGADAIAVLEGPQLFELFRALGRRAFELHELEQESLAIGVESDVLERRESRVLAAEGNSGAREVEREAVAVDHDLHPIGIVEGFGLGAVDDRRHRGLRRRAGALRALLRSRIPRSAARRPARSR